MAEPLELPEIGPSQLEVLQTTQLNQARDALDPAQRQWANAVLRQYAATRPTLAVWAMEVGGLDARQYFEELNVTPNNPVYQGEAAILTMAKAGTSAEQERMVNGLSTLGRLIGGQEASPDGRQEDPG